MYTPRSFRVQDKDRLAKFVRRYSFATMITPTGRDLAITHVPLLLDIAGDQWHLLGHFARVNDHWQQLLSNPTTAVFRGPHSYISPAWYTRTNEVPTWNYAVVHATGDATLIEDRDGISQLVDRTIEHYEAAYGAPWDRTLDPAYREKQIDHIVGFRLVISHVEGKFKLGQNRSKADQSSMLQALSDSTDGDSRALGAFIGTFSE